MMSAIAASCLIKPVQLAFGQDLTGTNPALDFQIPYEAKQDAVFYFTRTTFEPYVGGLFQTRGTGGRTAKLTLLSVRNCTPHPNSNKLMRTGKSRPTDCFTLSFRASAPLPDLATIYRLKHGALGEFNLFMTRRGETRGGILYEAVINHVIP
jgi:hypothetical protein